MEHDINLNIHYTAPRKIWDKINAVYKSMPYWEGKDPYPHWIGPDIEIWASVEPSGIQITGSMLDDIWESWYSLLKEQLSNALGYEIGEPEDGYDFHYYA